MGGNERIEAVVRRALREFREAVSSPNRKTNVRQMLGDLRTGHTNDAHIDPTSHYFEKSRTELLESYPEGRGSRAPLIGGLIAAFRLRTGRARSSVAAAQAELVSHISASFGNAIAAALTLTLGVFSAPGVAPAMHHVGHVYAVSSGAVATTPPQSGGVIDGRSPTSGVLLDTEVHSKNGYGAESILQVRRKKEIRIEHTYTVEIQGDEYEAGGTVFWTSCDEDSQVKANICSAYDDVSPARNDP